MSEHIAYWTDQAKRGNAVVFGPVLDPKGIYGVGIVEIEDEARLHALLAGDPAVKAELQRDEFYPMSPRSVVRKMKAPLEDETTLMEFVEGEIMEFLYKTSATRTGMVAEGPNDAEKAIIEEHFDYVKSLTDRGVVLVFGRTQNREAGAFGIVIFRAGSNEEAQSIMNKDPAVKQGIMHAELYPYKVAGLNARDWQVE